MGVSWGSAQCWKLEADNQWAFSSFQPISLLLSCRKVLSPQSELCSALRPWQLQFAILQQLQQPLSPSAPENPSEQSHASRGLEMVQISLLDVKEPHACQQEVFLFDSISFGCYICRLHPHLLVEDPMDPCPSDCLRVLYQKIALIRHKFASLNLIERIARRYLSYDCAGLLRRRREESCMLRMHECSFQCSHLI